MMNERERFQAIMNFKPVDRVPLWYFGQWAATKQRWLAEGLPTDADVCEFFGMDPDWMDGKDTLGGWINTDTITPHLREVLEETDEYIIYRCPDRAVVQVSKTSQDAMSHTIEYSLKPSREAWNKFKQWLDPSTPSRFAPGWEQAVKTRCAGDRVIGGAMFGLYRMPEFWMGAEEWCCLAYDNPSLLEDILEHMTEFNMTLFRPALALGRFDFFYVFEDCCFRNGPMISPDVFRRFFLPRYRRLTEFFHSHGVPWVLMDSDGKVDDLIPLWREAGVDIMFPVEVGVWKANPAELRRRFGRDLRMIGGFDKHLIAKGENVIRTELKALAPVVAEGGYIPMPDHKVSPECSLEDFRTYVRVFKEVFGASGL